MKNVPYRKRTHEQLEKALRNLLNKLQMRDWEIELITGDRPPKEQEKNFENSACITYDKAMLSGILFVNFNLCKERDEDPLWNLYHEIFHTWLNYHDDSEELQANILATLIM